MPDTKHTLHGGDLATLQELYQIDKNNVINFSGNVNPLGVSKKVKQELATHLDLISTYPDRDYKILRQKIGNYTGSFPDSIMVGNGSTELISLYIHLLAPQKALIIGPTYSEYEREITLSSGASHYYRLKEELDFQIEPSDLISELREDIDLLIFCNPNNPTSSGIDVSNLRIILDHCKEKNIDVMIDETYIEFVPDVDQMSAVPLIQCYNNLIIIRGISKFFAAPGLRLGYSICGNKDLLRKMNELKNPWTLNVLGSFAGEIMFEDKDYIQETRNLMQQERKLIYNELKTWKSLKVYEPTANFILIKILDEELNSHMVFEKLIKQQLLIRDASSFPFLNAQFIRFCFMLPEQNRQLLSSLDEIINRNK